ncbi:hypothetical protein Q1695_005403 [Nippostrongylus brasiliensis]|nr:hypothetical protein Q1695_005403 [Nippostrongylus brasiliensis]
MTGANYKDTTYENPPTVTDTPVSPANLPRDKLGAMGEEAYGKTPDGKTNKTDSPVFKKAQNPKEPEHPNEGTPVSAQHPPDATSDDVSSPPTEVTNSHHSCHYQKSSSDESPKVTARSVFGIVNYACFLAVLTYVALVQTSVQSFYFTKTIGDLFVSSKTAPARKAFTEISTIDDIWGFLEVEFLTTLYQSNPSFAVDVFAMVYYNNRLLGRPRIRMLKVRNDFLRKKSNQPSVFEKENDSCTVVPGWVNAYLAYTITFAQEISLCYSNYQPSAEDMDPIPPGDSEAYIWQSAAELVTEPTTGTISTYGGGGFVVRLPLDDITEATKIIAEIKNNSWIDRGTRAIIIDFALFNANVNLFSIARMLLELPASGGVMTSYRFNTYDLMQYMGVHGQVLIIMEGIFVGFVIYYIVEEIVELIRTRLRSLLSFWNIVDYALLALCCAEVYINYKRTTTAADRINTALENGLTDAAFDDVTSVQELYNNIASVILFLAWIKVFKYIGVNKTMNQLSATLSRSTKDIGGFAVMFAVFFFAYAQFAYLVFGTQILDYSTFISSAFALLRTILGDFNFSALEKTNRILGPLFFITYVFFVYFVLLNMFLAIINDSYVEVKAELARKQDGDGVFDWIRKKLIREKTNKKKPATFSDYKNDLLISGINEKDIDDAFEKLQITASDEVNDHALLEIGNEIREQAKRKRLIDEEYRSTAVLTRRVDMMDRVIFNVFDKLSKVAEQLNRLEHSRVAVEEDKNRMIAEILAMVGTASSDDDQSESLSD